MTVDDRDRPCAQGKGLPSWWEVGELVVVGLVGLVAFFLGIEQARGYLATEAYLATSTFDGIVAFWYGIGRCAERGTLTGAFAVTGLLALIGLIVRRWWTLLPFVAVAGYVIGLYGGLGGPPLIDQR